MNSAISTANIDAVTINKNLFRPGVLDYMRTIAQNNEAKILLIFEKSGEKITAAFVEVGKILKNIIFIPTEEKDKIQGDFEAKFFISSDGKINFA